MDTQSSASGIGPHLSASSPRDGEGHDRPPPLAVGADAEPRKRWDRRLQGPRWLDFAGLALFPALCFPLVFVGESDAFWENLAMVMGLALVLTLLIIVPAIFLARRGWTALELLPNRRVGFEKRSGKFEAIDAALIHAIVLDSRAVRPTRPGTRYRYLLVVVGEAELALHDRSDTSKGAPMRRDLERLKGAERIFQEPMDAPLHVIAEAIAAHVGVPVTIGENWVWHESDDVSALREERK